MIRFLRKGLLTAALTTTLVAGGVAVAAQPAAAATVWACPDNHVCVYVDVNFDHWHPNEATMAKIPVAALYDCNAVAITDGLATSFYNNTRFKFELWNLFGASAVQDAGTMAGYKGYRYLSDATNDKVDTIISPNC